jgi:hypothetical protein
MSNLEAIIYKAFEDVKNKEKNMKKINSEAEQWQRGLYVEQMRIYAFLIDIIESEKKDNE